MQIFTVIPVLARRPHCIVDLKKNIALEELYLPLEFCCDICRYFSDAYHHSGFHFLFRWEAEEFYA